MVPGEEAEGDHVYLPQHCHRHNDFCIKMGSNESHFNVSVGSDGQSHKTVSTNTKSQDCVHKPQPFSRGRRAEAGSSRGPSGAYQPNALPLGQTGSRTLLDWPVMERCRRGGVCTCQRCNMFPTRTGRRDWSGWHSALVWIGWPSARHATAVRLPTPLVHNSHLYIWYVYVCAYLS